MVDVRGMLTDGRVLNLPYIFGIRSDVSHYIIVLILYLIQFANILFRNFRYSNMQLFYTFIELSFSVLVETVYQLSKRKWSSQEIKYLMEVHEFHFYNFHNYFEFFSDNQILRI